MLLVLILPASAQIGTGTPPFSSVSGGPDVIDLANLNSQITIPVVNKAGRGTNFTYNLSYDSSVWMPVIVGGTTAWQPANTSWGWTGVTATGGAFVTYSMVYSSSNCGQSSSYQAWGYSNFVYHDEFGVLHPVIVGGGSYIVSPGPPYCPPNGPQPSTIPWTGLATDGSGYQLYITPNSGYATGYLVARNGTTMGVPIISNPSGQQGAYSSTDRNGNVVSADTGGHFYDTLSSTVPVLTLSGSPFRLTYTAPTGPVYYQVNYTNYTVATNFGAGITEYKSSAAVPLVTSIALPDGTQYSIQYEATPSVPAPACSPYVGTTCVTARIKSLTLPTGGTIAYSYSGGNNGIWSDGSAATLTRTTPDGVWIYAQVKGTGAASTTTITDPQSNKTVVQFQRIYETQRDFYQGAISPSNLLQTIKTCYNGNATDCTSTAVTLPISQRKIITVLPGGLQSEHDDLWNAYSAPTESDDYDFGTGGSHGALLKKTLATYTTMGNINAFAQTVTVCSGTGTSASCNNVGTPVAKINYNYDETSVTGTTGTPQHTNPTTARGNLTSTNVYVTSVFSLNSHMTYYDTGNLNATTGVNGGLTTYNYAAGLPSCYNSFATSITEAISTLSTSKTWNCTGGVQLTSTDENLQITTTAYTDQYFWRPASTTDPTGAITSICYGLVSGGTCSLNPNQRESTLSFNGGNSTSDMLTTLDGLGRTHVQQTRRGPVSTTFDSVETDYDSIGRVSKVTLPYSGSAGQTNSTIAATTTTYDALSRPLTVADGGLGSITYSYGTVGSQQNDVLVTQKPAPTGENTKARQLESDGLGRLTSICEVTAGTAAWPGAACGQNTAQTGYLTKYTYDPMGNLLTVIQNAQAASNLRQTRTFTYDWKNRLLSETVPEIGASGNGTANYTYDYDATCSSTSYGDLVKRVDGAGNVICSTFDALHRQLTTTYPSGPYSTVTPQKHFVYDSATVNIQTMAYAKARLAEAYTCFSPCSTKLTDFGQSYTVRGEISDTYESTPNSGTFYYHTAQTYWANGGPYQLSGNIGLPTTLTYGADSEGRTNTVSATSGQNPVTATTFNAANQISTLTLGSGSGDTDTYTYDPQTNRMTQYKFTVNSVSLTGALGWNANSTVQTQNITNGFNSAGTQNCTYVYDDVTRVTSANCGSAAAQTFSYDPFGNINKSGSPNSFQPTYSNTINRIASVSGTAATYDNNGNATNDTFHTFTWDADGRPLTVDSGQSDAVSVSYDALGRMVEQTRGSAHTQIVYSPSSQKLALMNGQTLTKAMVPLPGKAFAIYNNSSGPLYYAHPDLLGSIRLASTPARAKYFDTAYAPFGETYAFSGTLDPAYTGQMGDLSHRQDTAGGLYDFPAREYSTQGRWPSPDPAGVAATCTKDPQSQNRYAYVRNNPITRIDPNGMDDEGPCGGDDTLCWVCQEEPWLCYPPPPGFGGGGGGGVGGGGGGGEPTRTFPWAELQSEVPFFRSLKVTCECRYGHQTDLECFYGCVCTDPRQPDPRKTPATISVFSLPSLSRQCGWPKDNPHCPMFVETEQTIWVAGPFGVSFNPKVTYCSNSRNW